MDFLQNNPIIGNIKKQERNRKVEPEGGFKNKLQPGDMELLRPFIYQTSVPGKNLREKLIRVLNYWMDVPEDKLTLISEIVTNLHGITLLIDDIQDGAYLRRGVPAAHTIYGIDKVANACMFLHNHLQDKALKLNGRMGARMYLDATLELLCGQGMELHWRESAICPTEEEYEQMVLKKTGGIFFLINNYMQMFTRKRVKLDKLLTTLTIYFQINDDYMNLNSNTYFQNKGFCEDITEGKFSYPTMHAVNSNPIIGKEIMDILEMRTTDVGLKKHCLSLIERCGSFRYTRDRLKILEADIYKELENLSDNPILNGFLPMLMLKSLF